jgi:hypothetical protein
MQRLSWKKTGESCNKVLRDVGHGTGDEVIRVLKMPQLTAKIG